MLPRALLLSAVVIWGWTFVATKVLLAEVGPLEILALRLAIGLPFLGIVLLVKRVPLRFTRADARPLLVGGAVLTAHFLIQIAGLETTTASNTAWIVAASPLALAALSFVFLRERIGRGGTAGIAVATAGIVLLVSRGRLSDLGWLRSTGDWLVLVSAHTWAVYTVATRDLARRRDPLAVTFGVLLVAAASTGILFAASADLASVRALSPRGIAAALYLGIPGLALGQWFWQEGVARLGAARAGLYLYLEPLATVALAVPLLGEPFGAPVVLGGGLVLAGVYVGQRGRAPAPARDARGSHIARRTPASPGNGACRSEHHGWPRSPC
ncbi:MAG TPA: DMT family transporter [Longimicrobiales bacterium]